MGKICGSKYFSLPSVEGEFNYHLILLFISTWIFSHPYFGVVHDGVLYLAQGLLNINPGIFSKDIFFSSGSQNAYTIFPYLYAVIIKALGVGRAALFSSLFSWLLFALCLLVFCVGLWGRKIGILAACSVALMPRYYGGYDVFSYSETFFTARSLAEPLCLFALFLAFTRRYVYALLLLAATATLHPLVVLPCLIVLFLLVGWKSKSIYFVFLFATVFVSFSFVASSVGHKILATYDAKWWSVVRDRNIFVLPTYWRFIDWERICFDLMLVCVTLFFAQISEHSRRFLYSVLIAVFVAMAVSIFGTTAVHSVLLTGLQFWRVDWILHLVAMACIPSILLHVREMGGIARLASYYFVCAILLYAKSVSIFVFCIAIVLLYLDCINVHLTYRVKWLLFSGAWFICIIFVLGVLFRFGLIFENKYYVDAMSQFERLQVISFDEDFLKLFFAPFALFSYQKRHVFFVVALIGLGVGLVDRRSDLQQYIELIGSNAVAPVVPEKNGDEVYWHNNPLGAWVLLRSPSFYTYTQGSGVLFSRDAAMEFTARQKLLGLQNQFSFDVNRSNHDAFKQIEPSAMVQACRRYPRLEFYVFPQRIPKIKNSITWSLVGIKGEKIGDWYVYRCADLL